MWYKIDLVKLVAILTPPILRSKFLLAFLCVLILPLRYIYELFTSHRGKTDDRLNLTSNVAKLEKALNQIFYLTEGQIYITTPDDANRNKYLHFGRESQPPFSMYLASENGKAYLVHEYEVSAPINFIVMVPTFLCTSLESKDADKYGWKHLNSIRNLLNIYKPAGRTFSINLYDYE